MNSIIRTIKILSFNDESSNMTEEEIYFLSIFNNTHEIIIDNRMHIYRYDVSTDYSIFALNLKDNSLSVNYMKVWNKLELKFNMEDEDVENLIRNFFKNRLNINIKNVLMAGSQTSQLRINRY